MGNSLGCSASGERLVSAARDGDLLEARMLLEFNPCLAKYSTFGSLNSPLHFAAAKGHNEIVTLLLENGADVNCRNYCGQTALMQACRHGHWEVVQTLLLYRCIVATADFLSGRTALHFAAVDGHLRCIRLSVADFVPSAPYSSALLLEVGGDNYSSRRSRLKSSSERRYDQFALAEFVNKPADGGITALHIAALNGYADCVQLLLDLHGDVGAVTFPYGSSVNLIGAGSTPLHYAACGGNLGCCQILLSRGASRMTLNCNGWLPVDLARIWGRHAVVPLLLPNSDISVPVSPPSNFLSLPLMSILNIARDHGLQSLISCDESDLCPVCLERACNVVSEGCSHELCVKCALYLCSTSSYTSETLGPPGSIPCPLCRIGIVSFTKLQNSPIKELKSSSSLRFLNPCILNLRSESCRSDSCSDRVVTSDPICSLSCTPFGSFSNPTCSCDDEPCRSSERQSNVSESDKLDDRSPERRSSSCSGMFWCRSCLAEQQVNA